jgi:hypothetical protein
MPIQSLTTIQIQVPLLTREVRAGHQELEGDDLHHIQQHGRDTYTVHHHFIKP